MILRPSHSNGPWPGPQPYNVEDGDVFFGRRQEVAEIVRRVLTERLTILTGMSASGKTSLLRAGVVRALQHLRERSRREAEYTKIWPTLLLSEWSVGEGQSIEEVFRSRLQKAVGSLREWALDDYESLSSAPTGETLLEDVIYLCDTTGGVILALDQFEEVVRNGKGFASEALETIINLYRFERRARLLISLREEFHHELRSLESFVGNLYDHTYFLSPMTVEAVHEAILLSAETAGIQIEEVVATTILKWLGQWLSKAQRERPEPSDRGRGDRDSLEIPVDLLTLQSILRELFEFCRDRQFDAGAITIDEIALEEYRQQYGSIDELGGEALERWIDSALGQRTEGGLRQSTQVIAHLPDEKLVGGIRRIAARMAPFLSSGGYKMAAEEQELMYRTLCSDFSHLRPGIENVPRRLWEATGTPPHLDRQALGLSEKKGDVHNLSGLAREKQWSPADTADCLVAMYYETLSRLRNKNILKPIRIQDVVMWELVHDGLGHPFANWADKQLETWTDSVSSFTACQVTAIFIRKGDQPERNLRYLCWQGCGIGPIIGEEKIALEGIQFEECDLKGSVFRDCIFKGGSFRKCVLDGTVFINCNFERDAKGKPLLFDRCQIANAMIFVGPESTVDIICFESCCLRQMKMSTLKLNGTVHFKGTNLFLCHFTKLMPTNADMTKLLNFEDCKLDFCAWDEASGELMDFDKCDLFRSETERQ